MVDLPSAAARIAVNFPDMALLPVIEADREAQVEAMKKSGAILSFGGLVRASFSEAEKLKKSEAVVFYESDDEKMAAKNGGESMKEEPDAIEPVIPTPSPKATAPSVSISEVLDAVNRVSDRLVHNTDAVNQVLQRSAKLVASIEFLPSNLQKVPVTASPRPTGRQSALVTGTSSNLGPFPTSGSLKLRPSKFLSGLHRSRTIDDLDEGIVVAEKLLASKKQKSK
ncbi:hypothetical protein APSETT444_002923 [Aspergillus pseudonomiae]